jgi:hypothetical protein
MSTWRRCAASSKTPITRPFARRQRLERPPLQPTLTQQVGACSFAGRHSWTAAQIQRSVCFSTTDWDTSLRADVAASAVPPARDVAMTCARYRLGRFQGHAGLFCNVTHPSSTM